MSNPRSERISIAVAIVVIIFLIGLWHGRDTLQQHPIQYLSGAQVAPVESRPSFFDVAASHGTDKVLDHHYEQMYERRLAPLRDKPIKMLEIGLGCDMVYGPGASYFTWLEYFTNVDLYYIEYNAECANLWANKTEKATVVSGDQGSVAFLHQFLQVHGGDWDIIIDDGGHTMDQQRTSLNVLWPAVKPGGIYFIEDLATSYEVAYGGGGPSTMMGDIQAMLHDMNRLPGKPDLLAISKEVVSLEFTQELVAFLKKSGTDRGF